MMPCKDIPRVVLRYQMYQRFFSAIPKLNVASVSTKQNDEKKVQVDEDHQFGKKQTVRKLQQLLGVSAFAALGIANTTKNLSFVNGKMMTNFFETLKGAGVRSDTIVKYPSLLGAKDLERNLEICGKLADDMNDVAPFLTLRVDVLKSMLMKGVSRKRLDLLSGLLQISKAEACEALITKPFLRSINYDRISENLNVLLDNAIPIKDIHRDLWVLNYSTETIKSRLSLAKSMRVEQIKTWMVRCTPEVLDRYVARRTDNKQILGNNSLAEYLSEKLECSVEEAKVLMHKHPALQNKSMKKMKEILDFLFAQGFKPSQICRVPKILLHSVETTKQRLKELEPFGKHLDSLYLLTKSKKQYMQYFESLVKTSNKTKSTN